MKYLFCIIFLALLFSCKKDISCIDESKRNDGPCAYLYSPVCGCDNVTYSNKCDAENNGVKSWEEGECK